MILLSNNHRCDDTAAKVVPDFSRQNAATSRDAFVFKTARTLPRTLRRLKSGTTLLALVLATASALGATKTWDGGAASANWSDAANWNADGVPTSSDAVLLDNSVANPVPQISAQSGANCGTLTLDGVVTTTFLNYGGSTPLVTNLYGASVNVANTGPLLSVTANAPALVSANKVNFQLRTNGEFFVAAGTGPRFLHLKVTAP